MLDAVFRVIYFQFQIPEQWNKVITNSMEWELLFSNLWLLKPALDVLVLITLATKEILDKSAQQHSLAIALAVDTH